MSQEKKRKWQPRQVPVASLYAENQRLQRLLRANRFQVRGLQKALMLAKYKLLLLMVGAKQAERQLSSGPSEVSLDEYSNAVKTVERLGVTHDASV